MNNKILLIILVILVAIYAFTKFNSNEEREFNFFAVDSVDVAKIEMSQNGEKIVLAKSDDVWKLVEPLESKIEKRNLENIFCSRRRTVLFRRGRSSATSFSGTTPAGSSTNSRDAVTQSTAPPAPAACAATWPARNTTSPAACCSTRR